MSGIVTEPTSPASDYGDAFPASRKVHAGDGRVRVPLREIALSDGEPPLRVYDTSGPRGADVRKGLPPLRRDWIADRGDVEEVAAGAPGRRRAGGAAPAGAAGPRGGHADALRPARRGDGGDGVRRTARGVRPRVRALGGGPRPGDHPRQRQPPGAGADGDRPQLPGEDQRQHRQLGRHLVDRRGSGEAALGDAVGRGYDDGPLDRAGHPRHPRVDPAQLPGARRHGADLPGAGEGGRPAGGADLGDLPRHADRAGRAGRGLLHRPRRRAAALRAHDRAARHRHRLPRRVHPRQVVPGASPRELRLHPLRRDLRDHEAPTTSPSRWATGCGRGRSPTPTTRRSSPS